MSNLKLFQDREILPVSTDQHEKLEAIGDMIKALKAPKPGIKIHQLLHAGCYVRTAFIPKDTVFVSCQLQVPTVLVVSGDCVMSDTDKAVRIQGYEVLTGARMRQGIIRTFEDTYMTAFFATDAKTTQEAEAQSVADVSKLFRDSEE